MNTNGEWLHATDLHEFTQNTADFFLDHESRYVQVFSLLLEGIGHSSSLALVKENACVGFCFFDGKSTLYISDVSIESIGSLTEQVVLKNWEYTRIAACNEIAVDFLRRLKHTYTLDMNQYVYSCPRVQLPCSDDGSLRLVRMDDVEIANQMFEGFFVDCWPGKPIPNHLQSMLEKEIEKKNVFFWEDCDGIPVSMAAKVRTTTNTATISWVYTVKNHRGNGYGAKATAYLTNRLLKQGYRECNLFTDAANPISNHVYRKIGYAQIGKQSVYFVVR